MGLFQVTAINRLGDIEVGKGAFYFPNHGSTHMGINFGGFKVDMAEQFLDTTGIYPTFHEMCGETVA